MDLSWDLAYIVTGICICLGAQLIWQGLKAWLLPDPECPACMSGEFHHFPGDDRADPHYRCKHCGHILEK